MSWDANLTNLKYVLADLYFLKEDSIPVARDAGLPLSRISLRDKAINNWSEILDVADKLGKVDDIIRVALREYPDNEALRSAMSGSLTPVKPFVADDVSWKSSQPMVAFEKIMGKQSTLLPISWLEVGIQRARSVAKVKRADYTYGTGFLIKKNLFLTNNHVLPTREIARQAVIQFNYQKNSDGLVYEPVNYMLDPDATFLTSAENDWTLVQVKGDANAIWGAIDLQPVKITINDHAHIIQHPGGETKQIALHHNMVTFVDDRVVQYLADTLPGSSGSAVFNSQWQFIALHHAAARVMNEPDTKKPVYRNEGINVNCLLKDLAPVMR